jgi:hypothetical protein
MARRLLFCFCIPLLVLLSLVLPPNSASAEPEKTNPDWVEFDYEHYATGTPYRTHVVDSSRNAGVVQMIPLPDTVQTLYGIELKVSKTGEPGDLLYSLGTSRNGGEIATGSISAANVIGLYDLFYRDDFEDAVRVSRVGRLYLTLKAESGNYPEDYYLVYGPREGQGKPTNAEGAFFMPDGNPSFPVSYRLMTSSASPQGEDRMQFIREITAPPYSDAESLVDSQRRLQAGEVEVKSDWRIVGPPVGRIVIDTAIDDLKTFFERRMGLHLQVLRHDFSVPLPGAIGKAIIIGDSVSQPCLGEGARSESYRVKAASDRIVLCGADDRGVMRAVYYLEDVMSLAGGAFLKQGETTRSALYSPRLTTRVAPGNTFLTELSQPNIYTDGFLWKLSHQGFNAIYLYGNVEELTQGSTVFPELNDIRIPRRFGSEVFPEVLDARATERRYERLRDLVNRSRKYGLDVYLYYATNYHHPVPESLYQQYPDARGLSWGNSMCTSNRRVQSYLAETTRHVFQVVPGLKGLVAIFDSEGFFSCAVGGNREKCPRCRDRQPEDIVAEYLNIINRSMKEVRPDGELIAWSYFTGHPQWVFDLIPKLDSDITFQGLFDKGTAVERGGVRHISGDYLISEIGPPEHFVRQAKAAIANGMKLSAKTCHSYANEFVSVPYIPVPFQFHRRLEKIGEYPVQALLANWSHHGYSPSLNAEVFKWYSWDNAPEISELMRELAGQTFGRPAAPSFVTAWRHFSKAITYYPYSDPVGRYPGPIQVGPAHPLLLSPYEPGGGRVRDWQNDLEWTKPWGPELCLEYFGRLESEWKQGVEVLTGALDRVPQDKLQAGRRELGVATAILCSVRSIMNVIEFIRAREDLFSATDPVRVDQAVSSIREIATRELINARRALDACEADSRIGYASGGARIGGLYTPALIRRKIEQVETMLSEELPRQFPLTVLKAKVKETE